MTLSITDRIRDLIRDDPRSIKQIARASGLDANTLRIWGSDVQPKIHNIEAVLTVLGYELVIVPCDPTSQDATD